MYHGRVKALRRRGARAGGLRSSERGRSHGGSRRDWPEPAGVDTSQETLSGGSEDRSERARAERAGRRHQPRGQGGEGRPAVLLHRARRRRRRSGHVGVGLGKANEVPEAIRKAVEHAKKDLIFVPLRGDDDPLRDHRALRRRPGVPQAGRAGHRASSPAAPCGRCSRRPGVQDILTKTLGSNNPHNVLKATIDALRRIKRLQDLHAVRRRGGDGDVGARRRPVPTRRLGSRS